MSPHREIAYRLDPALWVREVLGVTPTAWQEQLLRAPRGAFIMALTARQVGKTTAAAWAIAHAMLFCPGSLSVIACPAQRQSAEGVRRIREILLKAGTKLKADNVYALELDNGSRALALPSDDETIRGLTVDAWIVADEAARLKEDLIAALHPMRARRPQARFAMLSTAWTRTDPFWTAWSSDNPKIIRLKATADSEDAPFSQEFLEEQRQMLGEADFKREYLGIPGGGEGSLHLGHVRARHTIPYAAGPGGSGVSAAPAVAGGPDAKPIPHSHNQWRTTMMDNIDPALWPIKYPLIAHDVARIKDRSTAVVGGYWSLASQGRLGIKELIELPQDCYGHALASQLAIVDGRYNRDAVIIADLSNEASYGEVLFETFGKRLIGVQIGSGSGDGTEFETRRVRGGVMPVYQLGRTYLLRLVAENFARIGSACPTDRWVSALSNSSLRSKSNRKRIA